MKNIDLRHLSILTISLSGLIFSVIFLSPKKFKTNSQKVELAILEEATNQIFLQRLNSIAWEKIDAGTFLSLGEKVKTDDSSNATIRFIKNNTKIALTKNSTIVIEDSGESFKLRLLEGNLYVKNSDSKKENNIEIATGKDGKESIKLLNAEATLSVTNKGEAELNLITGKVDATKSIKVNDSSFLGQIYPYYGETIYIEKSSPLSLINLKNKELSLITFSSNLKPEYDYTLLLLNEENSKSEVFKLNENIKIPIKPSATSVSWKLIAKNLATREEIETPLMKFNMRNAEKPLPQSPANQENLRFIESKNIKTEFKWMLPTPLDNIEIEIARDHDFKDLLVKEKVTVKTYFETDALSEEGQYHWRIRGFLKNQKNEFRSELLSDTYTFNLKKGFKLNTPRPISPPTKQIYYHAQNDKNKSIILTWNDIKDASAYLVTIKSNGTQRNYESSQNYLEIKDQSYGKYFWSVKAKNLKDVDSDFSDIFEYNILPSLELKILNKFSNIHYFTEKIPDLYLEWSLLSDAKKYEVLVSDQENFELIKTQSFNSNKGNIHIESKNQIFIKIIAKNNLNEAIATSNTIKITPTFLPIPAAPSFANNSNLIVADNDGNINIKLNLPNKNYAFLVYTFINLASSNKAENKIIGSSSEINLTNLNPGKYSLSAYYIDHENRKGQMSQDLTIQVKNESNLMAPKIKRVNVK